MKNNYGFKNASIYLDLCSLFQSKTADIYEITNLATINNNIKFYTSIKETKKLYRSETEAFNFF